ncbi:MAG: hypothetical protein ACRCSG_07035 [Cellulosilyticaceae bacterium]
MNKSGLTSNNNNTNNSVTNDATNAAQPSITLERSYVESIDAASKRITVAVKSDNGDVINNIIFLVSDKTTFKSAVNPNAIKTFSDILVGSPIKVEHSMIAMTSFPPQIQAYSITLLEEPKIFTPPHTPLQKVTIPLATITHQSPESNFITISYIHPKSGLDYIVLLRIDPTRTFIHHERNRRMYHFEDLTPGTKISVVHSPMMTRSLPPQTNAFEIIILQNQN